MTHSELPSIFGEECIIKWTERGENFSFGPIQCSGSSRVNKGEDYNISFRDNAGYYYGDFIRLSQINQIFISKITKCLVIILNEVT